MRRISAAVLAIIAAAACTALWAGASWTGKPEPQWVEVNESMAELLELEQSGADLGKRNPQEQAERPAEQAPAIEQVPGIEKGSGTKLDSGTGAVRENQGKAEAWAGQADVSDEPASNPEAAININSADAKLLDMLPGIGEKKAGAIVAYREEHGAFRTIEEIMNVKGIGEKMFERMKDRITVEN